MEFALEIVILIAGIILYLKRNSSITRRVGIITFGAALVLIQTWNTFIGRPPSSDRAFAVMALIFYTLFASVAFWLEKRPGNES